MSFSYDSNSGAKVQLFSDIIVIIYRKKIIIFGQNDEFEHIVSIFPHFGGYQRGSKRAA